jgi:solute carrier family 13 (sodium-dependent dicarboxylate transporter), member 2/3/5
MIRICLPVNHNICISVVIVVPGTKLMISAVVTLNVAAAALAIGAGVNPIPPVIAAGLACSISSAIPSTTPSMAIVYSSRIVRISNMFKTGMTSDLMRLA